MIITENSTLKIESVSITAAESFIDIAQVLVTLHEKYPGKKLEIKFATIDHLTKQYSCRVGLYDN